MAVTAGMTTPRVLILRSPGTNCNEEAAHAFALAGAECEQLHIGALLESPERLQAFQVFCLPGGFSYGDDIAAGRILGNQVRLRLADACRAFRDQGKLVLGICNGFQVLMKTGLLDIDDDQGPAATLTRNDCGHFEARWVDLSVTAGPCVFLAGVEQMSLPVAHAEGKFVTRDPAALQRLADAGRLVLRYRNDTSNSPAGYPANPNGSEGDVAGICDSTGRVLGLMPHPERFVDATQHPAWTRRDRKTAADGLRVFENAVAYFR
ncbi:MAG: phosphoribosylformylglycinamidine synthase I [Planctomycetota bacterium]